MKRNIGSLDRIVRLLLGALLVALSVTGHIGIWGYVGAVFVITSVINFCPLYRLVGVSTK